MIRSCLPVQGRWVPVLLREDPMSHGAHKRSRRHKKPRHRDEEEAPLPATRKSLRAATTTHH